MPKVFHTFVLIFIPLVKQLTTEKCMKKLKLRLDTFVCSYTPKILAFSSSLVPLKFSIHNDFKTRVLLTGFVRS